MRSPPAINETQYRAMISATQQITNLCCADLQRLSEHWHRGTVVAGELRRLHQQCRHFTRVSACRVSLCVVHRRKSLVGPASRRLGGAATLHHPANKGGWRYAPRPAEPIERQQIEALR